MNVFHKNKGNILTYIILAFVFTSGILIASLFFLYSFRDVIHKRASWASNYRYPTNKLIVFVGDSITAGNGVWVYHNTINLGESGAPISVIKFFADRSLLLKPKYACIMAGTNDCIPDGGDINQSIATYIRILEKYKANNIKVVITSTPPKQSGIFNDKIFAINSALQKYCSENKNSAKYIDLWPIISKDGLPNPEFYQNDLIHFKSNIYKIWERLVYDSINQYERSNSE